PARENRQFLQRAGRRAAARPRRAARDRNTARLAGERPVLAIVGDAARFVPVGRDQIHALRVAGQQHVALDVAALAPDVVLHARVHLGPRRCRGPVRWRHDFSSFFTTMAGIPVLKLTTGTRSVTSSSAQWAMSSGEPMRRTTAADIDWSKASRVPANTEAALRAIFADSRKVAVSPPARTSSSPRRRRAAAQ